MAMGITKRRKQPHLYREGARHQAGESHLDTARNDVQRAAIHSMIAHDKISLNMLDDSKDVQTKSGMTVEQSLRHLASVSNQLDDSEQTPL